jgi:uncharacterized protein (TIGR03437 family)
MRWNGFLLSIALASAAHAATFGNVVPIAGSASDIALDEARGVLYIANFGANRIEVMSLADRSIHTSMNVAPQPAALSMSPDGQFLLVAHYGALNPPSTITLINLNDNTRQTFSTGDPPLAVAFTGDGTALIATTTALILFDPITGAINTVSTFIGLGQTLPANPATFPSQIIGAQLSTSPDQKYIYGIVNDSSFQAFIHYDIISHHLYAIGIVATPKPLPRVSVAGDGSSAMVGLYKVDASARVLGQFPNAIASTNIGGSAIDSNAGLIYAQILYQTPTAPASGIGSIINPAPAGPTPTGPPTLHIMDADNLTVRDRLNLPENIVGRMLLSSAGDALYAVSDSGVTVFPVGRLKQQHRVQATQSDIQASGNFCNRNVIVTQLTITDPGGGNTDFSVSSDTTGVVISPSSGVTPATVQVRVDPNQFLNQNGTIVATLSIGSFSAVNQPNTVRLLINNRNPDQRGTVVDIPGVITDVLADPKRNRFYIVQQDQNQVLVFDSTTYQQVTSLRTATTPTHIAMTFDRQYLLIGHDNAQFAYVYDLDTYQQQAPIPMPPGHYPRSIAESGNALLALSRNVGAGGPAVIDRIDFPSRRATTLPALGVYNNSLNVNSVLAPAQNGAAILVAGADGTLMLYDANADTFTVSRKDFTALQGAYAASSYGTYVVGNYLLNSSLVAQATLESASGTPAGFSFVDQWGYRTTTPASTSPGVIQRVDPAQSLGIKPTRLVESPVAPSSLVPFVRTLAPLYDRSGIIALTISGFTVLPWNYDAAVAPPHISSVVNAADGTQPVAPGGLISVYGDQMSPVNMASSTIPLPTAIGQSCLTVNGVPVPMLFVSGSQINGQLPYSVSGSAQMTLHTPGGISDNFNFTIYPAAPSIFRTGTAGPQTGLATVVRADNGQLVTPTNPLHPGDSIVIYATGLGVTKPAVDAGLPAPSDPLASAVIPPNLYLGGVGMNVSYAGLVPGQVGVYQINATVPVKAPEGVSIPLIVDQGGVYTELDVRVVH